MRGKLTFRDLVEEAISEAYRSLGWTLAELEEEIVGNWEPILLRQGYKRTKRVAKGPTHAGPPVPYARAAVRASWEEPTVPVLLLEYTKGDLVVTMDVKARAAGEKNTDYRVLWYISIVRQGRRYPRWLHDGVRLSVDRRGLALFAKLIAKADVRRGFPG